MIKTKAVKYPKSLIIINPYFCFRTNFNIYLLYIFYIPYYAIISALKVKVEVMKKTIANSNKYFSGVKSKEKMIVNSVYTSAKVEGSKITKRELKEHYRLIHS